MEGDYSGAEINDYIMNALYNDMADDGGENADNISFNVSFSGGKKTQEIREYPAEKPQPIDKDLTTTDMITLLFGEIDRKGIAGDHINSMNTFYKHGIKQIITKIFKAELQRMKNKRDKTEEDREIEAIGFVVEFTDAKLKPPTTNKYKSQSTQMLTPNIARLKNLTYSAPLFISAKITTTATLKSGKVKTRTAELIDFRIATIPVMVKSELCNLYGCTTETLKELEEDPRDPGGYFIVKGTEWAVDKSENLIINMLHGYRNMYGREVVRGTFQSKPGDDYENSYYMIIRYLVDGQITVEIVTNKFDKLEIPFYLLFRAFGMTRDYDIVNNIVYGVENKDPVSRHIMEVLEKAFAVENKDFKPVLKSTDSNEILMFIAAKMNELAQNQNFRKDENAVKYINTSTHSMLDKYIFPHIGSDPKSRIRKMRFLGHLIHKLMRIEMQVLEPTDRDSYRNKRVHTTGVSLAKTFKTQFNFIIVQEIKKHLIRDFQNTQWDKVNLVESIKSAINPADLERVLVQSIITGEKTLTVKRNEVSNRVSSQQLYHKNDLNVKATLNNITTHGQSAAKATDRAQDMRMSHPTYYGFIGVTQSADSGEKVGMNKQMACSASIAEASSSYVLKDILLDDPDIIPLDEIQPEQITRQKLTKIFVNGDWIGFCRQSHKLVYKYRMARRYGDINHLTTIVWEPRVREVYFWVDVGRLMRPLVIVYNNIEEYIADYIATKGKPKVQFKQWIKLTKDHIRGLQSAKITMDDLRQERVIEYISPEEQENILLARNLDVLRKNANNHLMQFTHCDVDQALFGLVELSAPNSSNTLAARITMFTNQKKQTCGWFALNWPFRIDKGTILQYYCAMPIVRAFSNAITYPNGQNVILAYQIYTGMNTEDSLILNKTSVDRGMFLASHFHYEKTELEKGEQFGNPDFARTLDIKKDAVYEYIQDGFIKEGTVVKKGYVLIVKTAKLQKPIDEFLYVDRSVIYKLDEPAVVERVIYPRNDEDILIAKVKLRSYRPIRIGDKLSSFSGCKGINGAMLDSADMPYTETGLKPDVIINPHSVPTRMVIGQIIETLMGELAVKKGCLLDGTPFKKQDIDGMIEELSKKYGIEYGGHRRMYNGRHGNYIDTLVFIGPTAYQRLQKFVVDEAYAMTTGPTCALTRQALDGKANNGGLRVGEMEVWTLVSHGATRTLFHKIYTDSDGIELYICRVCGNRAIINERAGIYKCKYCDDAADIVGVPSSWVANLFFNNINAMGIKPTFEVDPIGYARYE